MEKALNEIGKLRNEMKVGFIELENQMKSGNESIQSRLESLQKQVKDSNDLTVRSLESFSKKVETGFLAIEEALESDIRDQAAAR